MKKIISVFIMFISFLVFHVNFLEQGEIERFKLENILGEVAEENDMQLWAVPLRVEEPDILMDKVISFAKDNHFILIARRRDTEKDLIDTNGYYIYTNKSDLLSNLYHLKEGKQLKIEKDGGYFTTDLSDKNADGYIDSLNPKYLKKFNRMFEFRWIDGYFDKGKQPYLAAYFIVPQNVELTTLLSQSSLNEYLDNMMVSSKDSGMVYQSETNELVQLLLFVSIVSLLLLFFCKVTKEKKEIMTRKSYGMSTLYIFFRKYFLELIWFLVLYVAVQCICFYYFVGTPRPVADELMQVLWEQFQIYCLMITVLAVGIILMIYGMKQITDIKKSGSQKYLPTVNVVLKVIVLVLIMNPLIEFTKTGITQVNSAVYMYQNKEVLQNLLFINGIRDGGTVMLGTATSKIRTYFDEHGGWYQSFDVFGDFTAPYMIANKNYISTYDLYDLNDKKIDVKKIKGDVLLVPERYQYMELDDYGLENNADEFKGTVVVVKNKYYIGTLNPMAVVTGFTGLDHPIVYVKERVDSSCAFNYPYLTMYLKNEKQKVEFESYLKEEGLYENISLSTSKSNYDVMSQKVTDDLISVVSLFVIYVTIISTFLYENVYVYFIENKTKFAVRYLNGSSFLERHGEMLYSNLAVYAIPLLYGYFKLNLGLLDVLMFTVIAVTVEFIAAYFIITKFEKNRIVEVLKGE